jgi:CHAT domain-containing protein/tetratricopeptide (TPR) repeat protein
MRGTLGCAACFGLLALCALGPLPARAAPPHPETPAWIALERARNYFRAFHADSALPVVEGVLRSPEISRDPVLASGARLLHGASLVMVGRARESEPELRFALRWSEAAGDSASLGWALRYVAYALALLGRSAESRTVYGRLLEFSLLRGDTLNEAYARLGLAYRALLEDRFAEGERGYVRAIALFRRANEAFLVRDATVGLCRCYEGLARIDDARRCYRDLDAVCREAGDMYNRSSVLNNLGAIEHMTGDLAAAERYYREAYEMYREADVYVGAVTPACNLALVQMERGGVRDAGQVLETALARTRTSGYRFGEAQVLERLAQLKVSERRYPEASDCIRRGLALAESVPAQQRTSMAWTFGRTLALMGKRPEAIDVLERESLRLSNDAPPYAACIVHLQLAETLLDVGRQDDALHAARRALFYAKRGESLDLEFRARVKEGVSQLRLRRAAEARTTLEYATTLWEANRGRQRDPESREYLGASARECLSGLIETYLAGDGTPDPGRVGDRSSGAPGTDSVAAGRCARVFEAIERFKARTLRERMFGPWKLEGEGVAAPRPVTLEEMQHSVLRDGELLIQTFVGPTTRLMVAVTPHECRIAPLPADRDLGERLLRLHSLAARPGSAPQDLRFLDAAARRLGASLFAPLRDLLSTCTRVIVAPDEELGVIPWAVLIVPGSDSASSAPLVSDRELVLVPSASILADLRRRRVAAPGAAGPRLLAVAGSAGSGADALPGAAREVRWLERSFAGVVARVGTADSSIATLEPLEDFDVLHLAGHTTLDDQHPWRSGIRLETRRGAEREEFLRADRIASLRLKARLTVLSSCESASGRIVSGEGVQSLSAAFVSAGVTTIVATLWPVSDRATERFMQEFYRQLASGRSAAAALRAAQLEARARRATRHPFYWAGFVVLGDGDVRVPLRSRLPMVPAAIVAILLASLLFWIWRGRAGQSPLTKASGETLSS